MNVYDIGVSPVPGKAGSSEGFFMSFFRAVTYLLMQRRLDLYIADEESGKMARRICQCRLL